MQPPPPPPPPLEALPLLPRTAIKFIALDRAFPSDYDKAAEAAAAESQPRARDQPGLETSCAISGSRNVASEHGTARYRVHY